MQLIEREAARHCRLRERCFALLSLPVFDDVARFRFVRHLELIAGFGNALQTENLDRSGRASRLNRLAAMVEHRAHFAVHRADDKYIADVQRAVLHQHCGDRTAAFVHARFDHRAASRSIRIGLEFAQIADEQNHFEQARKIFLRFRRDFHHHRVAAPLFGHQAAIGKLALHAFGLSVRLVNFVDGDNDGHIRGARVRDRFFGLRHHAVVRAHHEHHDIGNLCAARAHARERFVARRVNEHDSPIAHVHFIGADMLRDSARFSCGDFGFADGVEQAGFAVVHVAHHGNHGRARQQIAGALFLDFLFLDDLLFERDHLHDSVERFGQIRRRRHVQRLIDAGEYAAIEQSFQQILGANIELFGEFANGDAFGHRDRARLALHNGEQVRRAQNGPGPEPARGRTGCSFRSPSANRFSISGRPRVEAGFRA